MNDSDGRRSDVILPTPVVRTADPEHELKAWLAGVALSQMNVSDLEVDEVVNKALTIAGELITALKNPCVPRIQSLSRDEMREWDDYVKSSVTSYKESQERETIVPLVPKKKKRSKSLRCVAHTQPALPKLVFKTQSVQDADKNENRGVYVCSVLDNNKTS